MDMQAMIAGLVRHVLTGVGGGFVAKGVITTDDLSAVIGAIVTVFGVVWSVLQKRKPV